MPPSDVTVRYYELDTLSRAPRTQSNRILKLMGRGYEIEPYRDLIHRPP